MKVKERVLGMWQGKGEGGKCGECYQNMLHECMMCHDDTHYFVQ
jgi:hypothetical protein